MGRFDYLIEPITERQVKGFVKDEEEFIKDLNRDQMYEDGVMDVERPSVRERYAPSTIKQKRRKAVFKKTDFITLRWTGEFYKSLKVIVFEKYFTINSDNLIWARFLEVQQRFERALGLTEENIEKLNERLKDRAIKWLKKRR